MKKWKFFIAAAVLFALFVAFFQIHTISSMKYTKADSLLLFFEENFEYFEEQSFGNRNPNHPFGKNEVWSCMLGEPRKQNEPYNSFLIFELEYRTGNLFQIYPNTKFKNVIMFSEQNIAANKPRPSQFEKIVPTSRQNWYFGYVTDKYKYF